MVPIRKRRMSWKSSEEDALSILRQVFEKRMIVSGIFEDRAGCDEIIKASGGSLRDLIGIFEQSCIDATGRKLTLANVKAGIRNVRDELRRHIEIDHYRVLARIHLTKTHDNSKEAR